MTRRHTDGYEFSECPRTGLLVLRFLRDIELPLAKEAVSEGVRRLRRTGERRMFTDETGVGSIAGDAHKFWFALHADEVGLEREDHVAVLVAPDDRSHDFIEDAMQNAGYPWRVFRDRGEAEAWLLSVGVPGT